MAEISSSDSESRTTPQSEASSALNTLQTTMDTFLSAANIEAVYGPPIREGENIVIPTAEVLSVAGFGFGSGSGPQGEGENENMGSGTGGGGGGRILSRPVAAIIISPAGVRVEPIVDVTKVALALFTTVGFMAAMLGRMGGTKPPKFR
jgi:uncharacterized spore protein YtfJ